MKTTKSYLEEIICSNAAFITEEVSWFVAVLKILSSRFESVDETAVQNEAQAIALPSTNGNSVYENFIHAYSLPFQDRFILCLALVPHIQPNVLSSLYEQADFYGLVKKENCSGFSPSVHTALQLLAGNNLQLRFFLEHRFLESHPFFHENILTVEAVDDSVPYLMGRLIIDKQFREAVTLGKVTPIQRNKNFPAEEISTQLNWQDLVLSGATKLELMRIKNWLAHKEQLVTDLKMTKNIRHGYRALFYGPPGTGKSLAVSVIGKEFNQPVYRVDLSQMVSKYIGETEKNLSKVFALAENKNWILFFDEADALFSKRTQVSGANDRFANQEVGYLLQRIENYNGVIILASNLKENIDTAFLRRFQSVIYFAFPNQNERYQLWSKGFSKELTFEEGLNLMDISTKYEVSGGSMVNIIRDVSITSLKRGDKVVRKDDLISSIHREIRKEGKVV